MRSLQSLSGCHLVVWVLAAPWFIALSVSHYVELRDKQSLFSLTVKAGGGSDGSNV